MSEDECTCVGCKKKLETIVRNDNADKVICFCGQKDKLGGVPIVITINKMNKKGDGGPKLETADAVTQVTPKVSEHKKKGKKKKRCTIL
ncbi:unnamed protein product [Acanthoscelides obtectus]|uniref:Uncharacterized protein n=1 Tax=Acanthoscelides obtectus TaxID=200917 RepID=A0A9P0M5L5_ACAOB|nr:unnamed protein product [Acanthoscelides obtectus]CAK1662635.1 hypothetical protein AOBTE_LOCUS23246 [Acanthoscelides obtectus]